MAFDAVAELSRSRTPRSVLDPPQLFLSSVPPAKWLISKPRFSRGAATEKLFDS